MARKTDASARKKKKPASRPGKSVGRPGKGASRSAKSAPVANETYWRAVRKPVYALVFLLPMMILYETGVFLWGHQAARQALAQAHVRYEGQVLRNAADIFIRSLLGGLEDYLGWGGLFLSGFVIVLTLVVWQIVSRQSWTIKLDHVVGMTGESVLYASIPLLPYVVASFLPPRGYWGLPTNRWMDLFFDLGSGVYEEFIFRLVLVGLLILVLTKFAELDFFPAGVIAVGFSAVVFAVVHHVGAIGEPFAWMTFAVRTLLGLFFGAIYIARGFGIAAGAHVFYNILLGIAQSDGLS